MPGSNIAKPLPRVHILVAREAPIAIVFRRGPSAWFHIMRWWLDEDRLEHGAWVKKQVYPERCDVSSDGQLLLTFMGGGFNHRYDVVQVLSRAPWLAPLESWSEGDTWGRGWRFVQGSAVNHPASLKRVSIDSKTISLAPHHAFDTPMPAPSRFTTDQAAWVEFGYPGSLLVFTDSGFLEARVLSAPGVITCAARHDLKHLTPAPQAAPEWATCRDVTRTG